MSDTASVTILNAASFTSCVNYAIFRCSVSSKHTDVVAVCFAGAFSPPPRAPARLTFYLILVFRRGGATDGPAR